MVAFGRLPARYRVVVAVLVGEKFFAAVQGLYHVRGKIVRRIFERCEGVEHKHGGEHRAVFVVRRYLAGVPFLDLVGGAYLEPVLDVVLGVDGCGKTAVAVSVAADNTVVIHIGQRQIVVAAFVAVGEREVVALHVAGFKCFVDPRCVGHAVPVEKHLVEGEGVGFGHILDVLLGVEHLGYFGNAFGGVLEVVGDLALAGFAALCGDEHHAVACLGTVDCCGGGVFKHFDRCDVVGVEAADVAQTHTVDNIKRVGRHVRRVAAHAHRRRRAGSVGGRHDLYACGLALKGGLRIYNRAVLYVLGLYLRDGACYGAFFLHAVAYYHYFVEGLVVFLQYYVEGAVDGLEVLRHIANIGEIDCGSGGYDDGVFAVDVGCGANAGGVFAGGDADTYQRFVVLVGDCAAYCPFGLCHRQWQAQYEHGCDKQQSANCLFHNLVMI